MSQGIFQLWQTKSPMHGRCFSNFGKQEKNSFPQFHHVFRPRMSISAAMFSWSQHVWPIHIILTCVCFMLRHIHMHRASLNLVCVCPCASISDYLYCIYYSNMVQHLILPCYFEIALTCLFSLPLVLQSPGYSLVWLWMFIQRKNGSYNVAPKTL